MKKYKATLLIDEDLLLKTYCEGHNITPENCPSLEEVIKSEALWILQSGIDVIGDLEQVHNNKTSISIEWSVPDIQGYVSNEYEKNISDEDALVVLEYLEDNYDPTHGITWDIIYTAIDELSRDNSIALI